MLYSGWIITIVGMLGVFIFLILMVLAMNLMSTIITKFLPEKEVAVPVKAKASADTEIAVAIAAIKSYTAKENN